MPINIDHLDLVYPLKHRWIGNST